MADRKAAWTGLQVAATAHAGSPRDAVTAAALSEAAKAWALASGYRPPVEKGEGGGALELRFGRSKGKTVAEAPSDDLEWMAARLRENLDDPERARYRDSNQALLAAIEAELATRGEEP